MEINEKFVSKTGTQFLAAAVATLGAFGLGTVAGWTSPALPSLQNGTTLGEVDPAIQSWIGSIAPIGACISGPVAGFLVDRIGRKGCMLSMALPFILGWLLIGFAQSVDMILAGRFITGLCGGSFSLAAPVYISEIAQDSIRGTLGSALQLMINVGVLFTYVVGKYVEWNELAFICASIPAVFLILMIFMPESPRLLVSQGKTYKATKSLRWLRGATITEQVTEELENVKKSVEENTPGSFFMLFRKSIIIPLSISLALMFFQQWNGNNAVIFYTVDIFIDAGSDLDPNISAIIIGAVQVVASIISSILMDKAGRRILLMISGVAMTISLIILGIFFLKKSDPDLGESIGWLPLACLISFIVAFSIGFGPIAWLMQGEILPPNVKGMASALATAFNWLNTFVVTKVFENIKSSIGTEWCFWVFGIAAGLGTIFVYFVVPETKGKSLDEIQEHFNRKSGRNSEQI
ncbi:unnamed protein product [Allacma fusca]|uniref:Major facilitator superfamily (MFS) profile domain-containing protein n=1 Tax=Allacma fusca TaxID=39272 RepID=A0A8J2LFU4_9HEXA|nr:unnamed protein product [Allacma fusca]